MSSPAPESPPMEGFLTPRSKVAKMLADIDNASTPSPSETSRGDYRAIDPLSTTGAPDGALGVALGDDTEDDEDDVRKPTSRALRREAGRDSPINAPISRSPRDSLADVQDDDDLYSATPVKRPNRMMSESPSGSVRSEGLFVSPAKTTQDDSDDDLPVDPRQGKNKLAALVALKRAERESKEAAGASDDDSEHGSSNLEGPEADGLLDAQNPDIERIMSDAAPPPRKASKKALLEMERETQRLAREQALAHQMKVKKKFTTTDLFARFNFRQPNLPPQEDATADTSGSSVPNSDATEPLANHESSTPPSSPPEPSGADKVVQVVPAPRTLEAADEHADPDEDLPDINEVLRAKPAGPAIVATQEISKPGLRLAKFGKAVTPRTEDDSDDELEVLAAQTPLPAHLRVFDRVQKTVKDRPDMSSKAVHTLRHLARSGQYESRSNKKGSRPSVDPVTLEAQLLRKAREQAQEEQLQRIEELKARGIVIQTAEDKEKEAEEFESLLEKARQDAVKLRKMERKKSSNVLDTTEVHMIASDDESEDEDYVGSGSEDEDVDEAENGATHDLVDEAAEESDDEEIDEDLAEDAEAEHDGPEPGADDGILSEEEQAPDDVMQPRKARNSRIILDDEDDDVSGDEKSPFQQANKAPNVSTQKEQADPFAAFGFGNERALMSPTQAFNATMQTPTQATQEDSFSILERIAPESASSLVPVPSGDGYTQSQIESQTSRVADSQQLELAWETQPPETPSHGPTSALIETPTWEPTQDPGLPSPLMVGLRREDTLNSMAEHDTQSTVRLRISESPAPSAPQARRGRLTRRQNLLLESDDDDDEPIQDVAVGPAATQANKNAFREMARKRKEALTAAERAEARKEMRGMMDEDAEESEDEYAGLGGDDFVAPETEQDREMIDSSHIDVDERALAAHFAERERQREEAETSRLYKDLTTGALRRKQANMFDLDDDEDEMAVRRRQMRQREEARKRKLLLQDDNIAGLAEGKQSKGKDAFLKAIADDDGDDELIDLSDNDENNAVASTQDVSQDASQPMEVLQEISANKRKLPESEADPADRPPAKQRRTQPSAFRRPASLLEVQQSVSFLLDDPDRVPFASATVEIVSDDEQARSEGHSDSDAEDSLEQEKARQNDGGFAPNPNTDAAMMPPPRLPASQRRTAVPTTVVDRLSLKRHSSSSSNGSARTAWSAGSTTGFKAPSLLRRATTNMITSGANDRGVSTPLLGREGSGPKMGGSKKSSLAYQARADERKAIVEASARRRQENTAKIAELRRTNTVGDLLGRGLGGTFE